MWTNSIIFFACDKRKGEKPYDFIHMVECETKQKKKQMNKLHKTKTNLQIQTEWGWVTGQMGKGSEMYGDE